MILSPMDVEIVLMINALVFSSFTSVVLDLTDN